MNLFANLYVLLKGKLHNWWEWWIIFAISTLTNIISGKTFDSLQGFIKELLDISNFTVMLMWSLLLIIVVLQVIVFPLSKFLYHMNKNSYKLSKLIEHKSDDCFKNVLNCGGYSWGKDKTLLVCPDLFEGWKPQDIIIESIDTNPYLVPEEYKQEYKDFLKSPRAVQTEERFNNNTRWMVSRCDTNFSKNNKKVYITLKETNWLTLQFMWEKYKSLEKKDEIIYDLFINKKFNPNSFCLHLVLLTKDDKIITTAISKEKENDYPLTWAATIGEQIEGEDFKNGTDIDKNYVINWVRRALLEEFGIYSDQFEKIVPNDGIRVLSVDVEGDICNISLLTLVNLDVKFDEFIEETRKHPEIDKEFARINYVEIRDVPEIMYQTDISNSELHPSTFLRLVMTYLHRYGINFFVMEYEKAEKKKKQKVFFEKNI